MKAEHLRVGDSVWFPWNHTLSFRIEAILPPLIYPNYLEFHIELLKEAVYIPADRDLTLIGTLPVLM